MTARHEHAVHLVEDRLRTLDVFEYPQAHDQVERLVGERQLLAPASNDRQARLMTFAKRRRIGVEPGRQLHVAPEQLDHPTTAAAEVHDPRLRCYVAADQRLQLLAAGPPTGPHGPVAVAVRILKLERQQRATASHAAGIVRRPGVSSAAMTGARVLPLSGALAAAALGSTGLISPPPPVAGAPAQEVVAYYTAHHVSLEIESVVLSVGLLLLLVFAAGLHARIGGSASLLALAAVCVLAACTFVEVAVFQALAYRPDPDPARATLLSDLQDFAFQVTTFPALLFLAANAYAIAVTGALPRWLGLAAAAAAGLQVVAWVSFFAPTGTFAAGGIPSIVSFVALLGWTVACSLTMLIRGEGERSVRPT
jgi:hypothetical protein